MDDLTKLLSILPSETLAEAERRHERDMLVQRGGIRTIGPDPATVGGGLNINNLDTSNPERLHETLLASISHVKPKYPPPERLPCANVEVERYTTCPNPGKMACGACKLVSYCSRVSKYSVGLLIFLTTLCFRNVKKRTGVSINKVCPKR
jgi:hypothetical protein